MAGLGQKYRKQYPNRGKVGPHHETSAARQQMVRVVSDVRKKFPHVKVGIAFVHSEDRVLWKFRGPDKFRCEVFAENAYEARYKGWVEWLKFMKVDGYYERANTG